MVRTRLVAVGLVGVAILVAVVALRLPGPSTNPAGRQGGGATASETASEGSSEPSSSPRPRPVPGHEVYGYVPYWEMDDGIADHVRGTRLTTLLLFSVSDTSKGAINTRQNGYKRITGPIGKRMIRAAHDRGARVELVFTSFGAERNARLFADRVRQDATIAALVDLVRKLKLDGVNADIEVLDPTLIAEYGDFIRRLREAVVAADPDDRVSVATQANLSGAAMAAAAAEAGADRIFLMGYDYRTGRSAPGATSPIDRRDGEEKDLVWSLDRYVDAGVPVERTILGLPLYGVTWPVAGPDLGAPQTGQGDAWIPRRHLDMLRDEDIVPQRDETEQVEFYAIADDGSTPPPSPDPTAEASDGSAERRRWNAIYVDSPATLASKLALANERGLAGAGFWAIGYERGLPAFTKLIDRFATGKSLD